MPRTTRKRHNDCELADSTVGKRSKNEESHNVRLEDQQVSVQRMEGQEAAPEKYNHEETDDKENKISNPSKAEPQKESDEQHERRRQDIALKFKKALLEEQIQENRFPESVVSQKSRTDIRSTGPADVKPRSMELDVENKCFICSKKIRGSKNGKGQCEGVIGTNEAGDEIRCNKLMHAACALEYNASGFLVQYAARPECQDKLLCPDHLCRACDMDHMKQRAYIGDIIRCVKCMSGYHKECVPAGSKVFVVEVEHPEHGRLSMKMTQCPDHLTAAPVTEHMPICRCGGSEGLQTCKNCPEAFHPACRTVKEVDGSPIQDDTCDHCAKRETFRSNSLVVFFVNGRIELGQIKTDDRTEEGLAKVKLSTRRRAVKVPINRLVSMQEEYMGLVSEKKKQIWMQKVKKDKRQQRFGPTYKLVREEITSLFNPNNLGLKKSPHEDHDCLCKEEGKRCIDHTCHNYSQKMECPIECTMGIGGKKLDCGNRQCSEGTVNGKLALKKYEDKGWGVVANEDIERGEFLVEYIGEVISDVEHKKRDEYRKLSKDVQAMYYFMAIGDRVIVDAATMGNIARYFNHSCDSNGRTDRRTIIKDQGRKRFMQLTTCIVAQKKIKKGEEITIDYGWDKDFFKTCNCGTTGCRYTKA